MGGGIGEGTRKESWQGRKGTCFLLTANVTCAFICLLLHVRWLDGEACREMEAGCGDTSPSSTQPSSVLKVPSQRHSPSTKSCYKGIPSSTCTSCARRDASISRKHLSSVTSCSSSKFPETFSQHSVFSGLERGFRSQTASVQILALKLSDVALY